MAYIPPHLKYQVSGAMRCNSELHLKSANRHRALEKFSPIFLGCANVTNHKTAPLVQPPTVHPQKVRLITRPDPYALLTNGLSDPAHLNLLEAGRQRRPQRQGREARRGVFDRRRRFRAYRRTLCPQLAAGWH